MKFSDKLSLLIEECNLTQKRVANDLNIAPSTMGGYVQGSSEADFETLKRLAQYFDLTTDYQAKLPTHTAIKDFEGLSKDSVILLEQIRTIDKKRLREHIGMLDSQQILTADNALLISLGLDKKD